MRPRDQIAAFYLFAIRFELLSPAAVVRWADEELAASDTADEWLVDLSLSALRDASHLEALLASRAVYGSEAYHWFLALLYKRVASGQLWAKRAANFAYEVNVHSDYALSRMFDVDLSCIDEVHENWWLGETDAANVYVANILAKFTDVQLPPID